jgi:hypothetical protein
MAMTLKAGSRFKSAVCETQVMVIKAPAEAFELRCGGAEMIAPAAAGAGQLDPAQAGETLIGKRYVDAGETVELLCTKGGKGSLFLNGVALQVKQAKQLPSSD